MPEELGVPIRAGNTQMAFTNPLLNRRLTRATKNPLDKCTIVSIFPKEIDEIKCTIEPGRFVIPPGTFESPSILVVGSSSWWKDIDADQPMLEMQRGSIEVADAVIHDFSNAMVGCDMSDARPGLFFVLGAKTVVEVKKEFKTKLEEVKEKQDNWYKVLVRLADSLWARSGGNPLTISDEMRLAALSLNFNEKPWIKDFQTVELRPCLFCGGLRNPLYPICPSCKAIDTTHPLAATIKFAV